MYNLWSLFDYFFSIQQLQLTLVFYISALTVLMATLKHLDVNSKHSSVFNFMLLYIVCFSMLLVLIKT